MEVPRAAKRRRPLVVNGLLRLPTVLLHVVCSFLMGRGIDELSVCSRALHAECVKPGAWRTLSLPDHFPLFPSWWSVWLRKRIDRAASVGQLKAITMALKLSQWQGVVQHTTLESIRVSIQTKHGVVIRGLGHLRRLRELRLVDPFLSSQDRLPGSLEVLQAKIKGSLDCLASCSRLRVLHLEYATRDISLLPSLPNLRDLTLSDVLPGHMRHVAQCTQLVALRLVDTDCSDLYCLLDLPHDRLRTLIVSGRVDKDEALDVFSHFTRLQTLLVGDVDLTSDCLSALVSPTLLRLCVNYDFVTLFSSQLYDLRALRLCPLLQELHVAFHQIQNLDGLWQCRDLRVLDLRGTFLASVDNLILHCPKMQMLALTTEGDNVRHLSALRQLRRLDVRSCENVRLEHLLGFASQVRITVPKDSLSTEDFTFCRACPKLNVDTCWQLSFWDERRPFSRSAFTL